MEGHFVYIAQSLVKADEFYRGYTVALVDRLVEHNLGLSKHTAKFHPWKIIFYCAFADKATALKFEKYLKSGSGRAFANKHLLLNLPAKQNNKNQSKEV